jgi:hypothetical protein
MLDQSTDFRELAHRTGDGIDVRLLWHARTNQVSIAVLDERSGELLAFEIDPAEALTAFAHPFVFAPTQTSCSCPVA